MDASRGLARPISTGDADTLLAFVRPWSILLLAPLYPLAWLLAPGTPRDPWLWWWLAALPAIVVALLALFSDSVEKRLGHWFSLACCAVSLQIFMSAHVNAMQPFYAVGSAMAVMGMAMLLPTRSWLVSYFSGVAVFCVSSYALEPDPLKFAYWIGALPLLMFAYSRLNTQLDAIEGERQQRALLERQVDARTRDLRHANRRLQAEILEREHLEQEMRVVQKMEAVGRLSGGLAHEFNNLITTITVYSELLRQELSAQSASLRDIDQIQESAQEAAGLIRSLLSLSRPATVETRVLDLREMVTSMEDLIRHLLGERSRLELRLSDDDCHIRANADQIHQVLINLVINARDAMPDGGLLAISLESAELDTLGPSDLAGRPVSSCAVLVVSDSGVGMNEETRSRVFDPFFTTKDASRGTGLGLSAAYGIVTQAGGAIRVTSAPGAGSRFELVFPLTGEDVARVDNPAEDAATQGGNERILLVEDEEDLRDALHRVLVSNGYSVIDASDGAAALDALGQNGDFDLVVSDVVMPRMSGIELAELLVDAQPETRVLLLSGYLSHPSIENRDLPASAAFLAKPFTPTDLAAKVRSVLDAA